MGIFSNWFGSSSASSSGGAGKIEAPRNAQGPPAAAGGSAKSNVWRSVFDPGSNPNIDKVGSSYYDTVHKPDDKSGSTWEQILRAQDFKRRSFSDIDRDKDGYVDAKELAAILPPSVVPAVDTSKLLQEVKPEIPGKMSRKEYQAVLDKYFLA